MKSTRLFSFALHSLFSARSWCLLLPAFLVLGCASRETLPSGLNIMSESKYQSVVDEYSDSTERYSGLYNTITMRSTLVNSKVAQAQLDQNARIFLWDQNKFNEEATKTSQRLAKETEVFISFYTPTRKHDNLHRSKTLWKIFLDVNGKRYEGKASKIKLLLPEVQGLYAYHTTFATPYSVIFPVPVSQVEKFDSKLTVTGPIGTANVNFPAVNN